MRYFSILICYCLLANFLCACSKISPTHFWSGFHAESIANRHDDTGPRGGSSDIHWQSEKQNDFDITSVQKFAVTHNWKFISQQPVSKKEINEWKTRDGRPIFPLGFNGFAPGITDSANEKFPRVISEDATLLTFDSGWIIAMAGTTKPAYAYILITKDGKQMALYHLWGQ
jgi:hypothetical protein